jgi:hypothetical protein
MNLPEENDAFRVEQRLSDSNAANDTDSLGSLVTSVTSFVEDVVRSVW